MTQKLGATWKRKGIVCREWLREGLKSRAGDGYGVIDLVGSEVMMVMMFRSLCFSGCVGGA